MRKVTIDGYTFNELNEKVKAKVSEDLREYHLLSYGWWNFTESEYIENNMRKEGFDVPSGDIYFNLYDGKNACCFDAVINMENWLCANRDHKYFSKIVNLAANNLIDIKIDTIDKNGEPHIDNMQVIVDMLCDEEKSETNEYGDPSYYWLTDKVSFSAEEYKEFTESITATVLEKATELARQYLKTLQEEESFWHKVENVASYAKEMGYLFMADGKMIDESAYSEEK